MTSSETVKKSGASWRIPVIIVAVLVIAFAGLKGYEAYLANRIKGHILEAFPSVETSVKVDLLGKKVSLEDTNFTFKNLMPGFSPVYSVQEVVMDDLNVMELARGDVRSVNRVAAKNIKISTPFFTGSLDEFVQEGLTGDLQKLGEQWQRQASPKEMIETAKTLHLDRYYFKNYVIKTGGFLGRVEIVMGEMEMKDLSLTHMGAFTLKNFYSSENGLETFRLGSLSVDSLDFPGAPEWLSFIVGGSLFMPDSKAVPAPSPISLKGLVLKDFSANGVMLGEWRVDMERDAKEVYTVQSFLTGLTIPQELYGADAHGRALAELYAKPLVVSGQADFTIDGKVRQGFSINYPVTARDFTLEVRDMIRLGGQFSGLVSDMNGLWLKEGDILAEDLGGMDLFMRAMPKDDKDAFRQAMTEGKARTADEASREYIGNLEKFVLEGGSLRTAFSAKTALALNNLITAMFENGTAINLTSKYLPK